MLVTKVAFAFSGMNDLVVQLPGTFEAAVADALDACEISGGECQLTSAGYPERVGGKQCSITIYSTGGMPTEISNRVENAIRSEVMKYLPDGALCETVCIPSAITSLR